MPDRTIQLESIGELIERKREMFGWYRDAFRNDANICLSTEPKGVLNSYWMVTAVWDRSFGKEKNDVVLAMREMGVDVRPFFHPLRSLPAYSTDGLTIRSADNPVNYDIASRAINHPSGFNLRACDVSRIRQILLAALTGGET